MIVCDKCGAKNDEHRLICCDCRRELFKKLSKDNFIPMREEVPMTGSSHLNNSSACNNCGYVNNDEALFCKQCGHTLPLHTNYTNHSDSCTDKENDKFTKTIVCVVIGVFIIFIALVVISFYSIRKYIVNEYNNDIIYEIQEEFASAVLNENIL